MLTLTLIRHAKSSWKDIGLSDFDRPLNKRGRHDAPEIGAFMASQNICPDLILCSASRRTRETFNLIKDSARFSSKVSFLEELYLIGQNKLMKLVQKTSSEYGHVCIIAHNPGLHEFVLQLTLEAPREALSKLAENFPTAALAQFEFKLNKWSELSPHTGKMTQFITPALLSKGLDAA